MEGSSELIDKCGLCPDCVFSTTVGHQQMCIEQWARTGNKEMMETLLLILLSDGKDRCIKRVLTELCIPCYLLVVCDYASQLQVLELTAVQLSDQISRHSCILRFPHFMKLFQNEAPLSNLLSCPPQSRDIIRYVQKARRTKRNS